MIPEKIHSTPTEGIGFSGGGGSICLIFQWEGGVHHREIFPKGPLIVTRKRVTAKKNKKKFTTTIHLQRYKTRPKLKSLLNIRINEHSKHDYFVSPLA